MDNLVKRIRDVELRRVESEKEEVLAQIGEDPSGVLELSASQVAEEKTLRVLLEWSTQVRATETDGGASTLFGDPEEVLERIDELVLEELSIYAPVGRNTTNRATLRLSRSRGCSLTVEADDDQWASAAVTAIARQVNRGVPRRWAWIRSRWMVVIHLALLSFLAVQLLRAYTEKDTPRHEWIASAVLLGVGVLVVALGLTYLVRHLLPSFELLGSGSSGTIRRVVASAGFIATELAIGFLFFYLG